MPVPANRVPVRVARGTYAVLSAEIASLQEGEVCYATDQDLLYVIEGGALVATGANLGSSSIDALSDVDTTSTPPANGEALVWDGANWVPGDASAPVTSVNGQVGAVVLDIENLGNVKPLGVPATVMLNMEGTNGGTTFTDTSPNGYTITPNGAATTSSTQFKYGSTSLSLPSTGSNLLFSQADSEAAFNFGSGDFTVEAWVYCTLASTGNTVYGYGASSSIWASSFLEVNSTTGALLFTYSLDGSNPVYVNSTTVGSLVNNWHHVAICRSGGSLYGYIDGVQVINTTITGTLYHNPAAFCYVGATNGSTNPLTGYIDDFRVMKGTALYTTAFTPPTEALDGQGGGVADGQVLTWVAANNQWEPGSTVVASAVGRGDGGDLDNGTVDSGYVVGVYGGGDLDTTTEDVPVEMSGAADGGEIT